MRATYDEWRGAWHDLLALHGSVYLYAVSTACFLSQRRMNRFDSPSRHVKKWWNTQYSRLVVSCWFSQGSPCMAVERLVEEGVAIFFRWQLSLVLVSVFVFYSMQNCTSLISIVTYKWNGAVFLLDNTAEVKASRDNLLGTFCCFLLRPRAWRTTSNLWRDT